MSIRFDFGELKKPHKTSDGMLLAEATFARDGILEYRRADGSIRRELRLPETNQDSAVLTSFGLAPMTIEHPPELVNEDNADRYRKGISLQNVRYEGKGGFVRGEVALMDSEAINLVNSRQKVELSAGYTCDVEETPGVWKGQNYDAIQRNVRVNHIALTTKGRAGSSVRLHTDSFNDPDVAVQILNGNDSHSDSTSPLKTRMATVRIDSAEYSDIPEVFASVVSQKLQQLDTLLPRVDSLESEKQEWESERSQLEDERDRHEGRADAVEVCLANAELILSDLGYRRDGDGGYFRVDGKKMPPAMESESDEEYEGEEEGEEEMPPMKKAKGKKDGKKCDSADEQKVDAKAAAKALTAALREADRLVPRTDAAPESFSDLHFDSVETPEDVRRLVVATLRPHLKAKLDSASDAYVEGVYDDLKAQADAAAAAPAEEAPERTDSETRSDASDGLLSVIAAARSSESVSRSATAASESAQRRMNAHKQPLSMTKDR